MTGNEVRAIIAANPRLGLYVRYAKSAGGLNLEFHHRISKTRAIRNAKLFTRVQYGTYLEQRPDLNPARVVNGEQQIVTFVCG